MSRQKRCESGVICQASFCWRSIDITGILGQMAIPRTPLALDAAVSKCIFPIINWIWGGHFYKISKRCSMKCGLYEASYVPFLIAIPRGALLSNGQISLGCLVVGINAATG